MNKDGSHQEPTAKLPTIFSTLIGCCCSNLGPEPIQHRPTVYFQGPAFVGAILR